MGGDLPFLGMVYLFTMLGYCELSWHFVNKSCLVVERTSSLEKLGRNLVNRFILWLKAFIPTGVCCSVCVALYCVDIAGSGIEIPNKI